MLVTFRGGCEGDGGRSRFLSTNSRMCVLGSKDTFLFLFELRWEDDD
jgi:hypothetical protein